jgi:uncharacterized membrane protein
MRSIRNKWTITAIVLLLACGAVAQLPESLPAGLRGVRLPSGVPLDQPRAAGTSHSNGEAQSQVPALSLTWEIYTYPGSVGSYVGAVNKSGRIVGGYGPGVNNPGEPEHGFLLKSNKFTSFDYPGASSTVPYAINDPGEVVGAYLDSSGFSHSFQLKGGKFTTIDPPGSNASFAEAINKAGDIVGTWSADNFHSTCHGYLYSKGAFTNIDYSGAVCTYVNGINNVGELAGYYAFSNTSTSGFVYSKGTFTTLNYPGGYAYNGVFDINDNGLILGGYGNNGYPYVFQHCYLYQSGTFTSCDPPFGPPAWAYPSHLNDFGIVAGGYVDNSGTNYGFEATVGP